MELEPRGGEGRVDRLAGILSVAKGKGRRSYLHEQFDLRLFLSHGCGGDQEAAVAGGTGRGRGEGRRVSRPGILSRLRAVPSAQPKSDQTPRFAPTRLPHRPSAPHTQRLHLGPSRLAQGAADSPASPALDLGRGPEGRALADRSWEWARAEARGLGDPRDKVLGEKSRGSLNSLTSPKHSTPFVPQFPRFVSEKGGHCQTGKRH